LLRQTFMGIPRELDEAARVEGASTLQILWRVYVPLARPVYTAFALVSVSFHWNNFLWPLIITNSVQARPLTVGCRFLQRGIGRGMVDHLRRHADDFRAAADRIPAVPAPVRAKLHARGHQVSGIQSNHLRS
jgi:ABC-type glycerol-3-phosphate transport system permease component